MAIKHRHSRIAPILKCIASSVAFASFTFLERLLSQSFSLELGLVVAAMWWIVFAGHLAYLAKCVSAFRRFAMRLLVGFACAVTAFSVVYWIGEFFRASRGTANEIHSAWMFAFFLLPATILIAVPLIGVAEILVLFRRRSRRDAGLKCLECGYPRTIAASRCPECGMAY